MSLRQLTERIGTMRKSNPHQFVNTPGDATAVFLQREARRIRSLSREVWECASGAGSMVRVLEEFGFNVTATDIRTRGIVGQGGVDFLQAPELRAPVIVTNPPYAGVAAEFVRHAVDLEVLYLALLLPSGYFQASKGSIALYREIMPSRIWPIGFRTDFTGQKKPLPLPVSWFVWDFARRLERRHRRAENDLFHFGERATLLMPALTREGLR